LPTYEYQCDKCGNKFEKFQKMSDNPLDACPKCGGVVHRLIGGGGGIIFKGTGFYQTDYKGKSKTDKGPSCPGAKNEGCGGCPHSKETK
jgi:putative FmdB family regulatory protein